MLSTKIDIRIIEQALIDRKNAVLSENHEMNIEIVELYNSFLKFLKLGTDLKVFTIENQNSDVLKLMTTGRGKTKIEFNKFIEPNKQKFPSETHPQSIFFIIEPDEQKQKNYIRKNSFVFGFNNGFINAFRNLILFDKNKVLFVRKEENLRTLKNWRDLDKFVLPTKEIFITDRYLLDDLNLFSYNLYPLLESLLSNSKQDVQITLYSRKNNISAKEIYSKIKTEFLDKLDLRIMLKVTLAIEKRFLEHDRFILTDYLIYSSGDSLNYFKSGGSLHTRGTTLTIHTIESIETVENFKVYLEILHLQELKSDSETFPEIIFKSKLKSQYGPFKSNSQIL